MNAEKLGRELEEAEEALRSMQDEEAQLAGFVAEDERNVPTKPANGDELALAAYRDAVASARETQEDLRRVRAEIATQQHAIQMLRVRVELLTAPEEAREELLRQHSDLLAANQARTVKPAEAAKPIDRKRLEWCPAGFCEFARGGVPLARRVRGEWVRSNPVSGGVHGPCCSAPVAFTMGSKVRPRTFCAKVREHMRLDADRPPLELQVTPRKTHLVRCSSCKKVLAGTYVDRKQGRRVMHVLEEGHATCADA